MEKFFLLTGSLLGGLSVALGAFGAHALKKILEAHQQTHTFELASRYQFYHALAILITGVLLLHQPQKMLVYSGYSFLIGTLIFSGSLYVLALTNIRWLGAITPIGGVGLILGWLFLLLGIYQGKF